MTSTIAKMVTGFDNSAWRAPFVYAELSCGHSAAVQLAERDPQVFDRDFEHRESNWLTKLGDEVECELCDQYRATLAELRTFDPATISHSRARSWCGRSSIQVYRYDKTSPTGVLLALSIDDTEEVVAVLRERFTGCVPLSPTEQR